MTYLHLDVKVPLFHGSVLADDLRLLLLLLLEPLVQRSTLIYHLGHVSSGRCSNPPRDRITRGGQTAWLGGSFLRVTLSATYIYSCSIRIKENVQQQWGQIAWPSLPMISHPCCNQAQYAYKQNLEIDSVDFMGRQHWGIY